MLELALYPSVYPCLTRLEREARVMSEKKHSESNRESSKLEHRDKESHEAKEQQYGRNSAEDPAVSSSKSDRHVPSNARSHPRAELKPSEASHSGLKSKPASNHVHNHVSGSKRKRSNEEEEEEEVWTEHVSSSGRVYFYNKKLDKSQWEKPKSLVKKAKQDNTPTSGQKPKSSGTPSSSRPSTSSSASASKDVRPGSSASKDVKSGSSVSRGVKSGSSVSKDVFSSSALKLVSKDVKSSSKDMKSGSSSSATKHSHLHPHSGSSSSKEKDSGHRGHPHAHPHAHSYGGERDKSGHAPGGREKSHLYGGRDRERERGYGHHHGSSKKSPRKSHSRSVSPASASKSSGKHRHEKTPSRHSRAGTAHSTTPSKKPASLQTSPLTPMTVKTPGGSTMMSPGTPGIAPLLSQSLTTTQQLIEQQLIEQTSILIAQQQRMLTGTEAVTPIQSLPLPTPAAYAQGSAAMPTHPQARQRLMFPYPQPSNGPYGQDSSGNTPVQSLTPPVHRSQGGSTVTSPQPLFPGGMDKLGGLHPLQKALLLQQQQQQQLQAYGAIDPAMHLAMSMVPINQPLQPLMSVATAIPHRMTTQVLTSPPLSQPQSPIGPIPNLASLHGTPTAYPLGQQQPLQMPVPQPSVYISPLPQGPVTGVMYMGGHDGGIVANTSFIPINSPTLQTPMSRLGYKDLHSSHSTDFPGLTSLEPLPQPQVNPEQFSKSLAESWWTQTHETLQKQIDSCRHESLSRRVAESMYHLGRVARSRLSLDTSRVWTNSREGRILRLRTLRSEIEKR